MTLCTRHRCAITDMIYSKTRLAEQLVKKIAITVYTGSIAERKLGVGRDEEKRELDEIIVISLLVTQVKALVAVQYLQGTQNEQHETPKREKNVKQKIQSQVLS